MDGQQRLVAVMARSCTVRLIARGLMRSTVMWLRQKIRVKRAPGSDVEAGQ